MTRDEFQKHWNVMGILSIQPSGLSLHPEDGEALVEEGVIVEAAMTTKAKEKQEEKKARSYMVFGMGVSFVPGLEKGKVYWVGRYDTLIGVTTNPDGKLVNA
jgi:hypothetical protein